jgi:hypothetical protein
MRLPVSTTHFADTESVSVGSAVSTGVGLGHLDPHFQKPRLKTFNEALVSRSHSNPQLGQECSLTQMGFAISTPDFGHSFAVPHAPHLSNHIDAPKIVWNS